MSDDDAVKEFVDRLFKVVNQICILREKMTEKRIVVTVWCPYPRSLNLIFILLKKLKM